MAKIEESSGPALAVVCIGVEPGGDDKDICPVTARHGVLPLDTDDNKEYERRDDSTAREDVVVLCTSAFNEKLAATDYEIRGQELAITDTKERVERVKDADDPKLVEERDGAEQEWKKAEHALKELRDFRHEIATRWRAKEQRVFGELA